MPTPIAQRDRTKVLKRQIKQNEREVRDILLKGKNRIEAEIIRAASMKKLATSAAIRDGLYRAILQAYSAMGGNIVAWADATTTAIARQWFKYGIDDLPKGTINTTWQTFSQEHLNDYLGMVHPENAKDLAGVNVMATQDIRWLRQQFVQTFRENAVTGGKMTDLQDELRQRILGPRPAWKFVDQAGREWEPKNYFNMLVRTTASRVSREAYLDTTAGEGEQDLYFVEGGPPTSPPPDPCWNWYGKILSLTGETEGYPTLAEAEADGLFHPNCIHSLTVVMKNEVAQFEDEQATFDESRTELGQEMLEEDEAAA